jgi:uncharacterized protein YeaO (DUF488 family)
MAGVEVVRVYGEESGRGGYRVLVDRLWPRGVKKAELAIDEWAQDVAPSHDLRKWYGHDPRRFEEFARRYAVELERSPGAEALAGLANRAAATDVTLLTATKDIDHSGATVLADLLRRGAR